jgi:hypothetical protein
VARLAGRMSMNFPSTRVRTLKHADRQALSIFTPDGWIAGRRITLIQPAPIPIPTLYGVASSFRPWQQNGQGGGWLDRLRLSRRPGQTGRFETVGPNRRSAVPGGGDDRALDVRFLPMVGCADDRNQPLAPSSPKPRLNSVAQTVKPSGRTRDRLELTT